MNYLVTGGAGFLGINLIRYLITRGHTVTSLDIASFDYPDVADQVNVINGDIRDPSIVAGAVENAQIVVHAAAALPLYRKEEIFTTDIDGTRNVIDAAYRAGVDRFIHISSTAVYGIPDHHPLLEEDPLKGVGPYGEAKIKAEQVCLAYRERGMCVPIIRPKSFVGPERLGVFAVLYDWAKDGKNFPMIGNGKNRYQLLDVEDLCQAIYLTATLAKDKVNDIFNIGAGEFATMKEDYQAVLDSAGFNKHIIGFPATPAIWALRLLEVLRLSPIYKWVYETAAKDSFVSITKAQEILGFTPQYSNKDALIRNYQWYLRNFNQFCNVAGISHRVPWKQGVLKLVKKFF